MSEIEIYIAYAPEDESWSKELIKHLIAFRREGLMVTWHTGEILPGQTLSQEIDYHLTAADIILLLISSHFLASDHHWGVEVRKAMERHEAKEALVIPVILRHIEWQYGLLANLNPLPKDGKPVDSKKFWNTPDEALQNVAQGIHKAILELPRTTRHRSPLWYVPFSRNPFFTGREVVLSHLSKALQIGKPAAIAQPHAISGLGGIGKTQTAVEYAYRHRDLYQAVLWVQSQTRELLSNDFVAIATLLNLPEKDALDQSLKITAVKRWLTEQKNWLLILDNADDLAILGDVLPSNPGGHILITTRADALGKIAQRIKIDTMKKEEGVRFLLYRAGVIARNDPITNAPEADEAAAQKIVEVMGGLPLALDQAGAYIEESSCSLTHYLELYQTRRKSLLRLRGEESTNKGGVADKQEPVAITWSLDVKKLKQSNPLAVELLHFCAFLSPDEIPEELINNNMSLFGPGFQTVSTDPLAFDNAMREILKYSLVQRHPQRSTLSIHRLMQEVLKDEMDHATQRRWAKCAVQAVYNSFPSITPATWLRCQIFLPHALTCASNITQWDIAIEESAGVLHQAAYYLDSRAQYGEAEVLYQLSLSVCERALGSKHPKTAISLNNLANLHYKLGKVEKAEKLYQRALTINEHILGTEAPGTATTLNNLANLYFKQGKDKEAEVYYQRALTIRERVLGSKHSDTAMVLNNLAILYHKQRKYKQAETLYQRALTIREQDLGSQHPDTATSLNDIATLYHQQGKQEQAETLYRRALAIREQVLGPEHPDTASTLYYLANLHHKQGEYEQAETLYLRALTIREQVLGSEHSDTILTRRNLANLQHGTDSQDLH